MTDEESREDPADPTARTPEPPTEQSTERTGGNRNLLVAIGAVVALAVVGLVVFLVVRPDTEESADPGVPTISGEAAPTSVTRSAPPSAPVTSGATEVSVPPPPADPEVAEVRTVVDDAIAAINTQDVGAMARLACDPEITGQAEDLLPGVSAVLTENPQVTGDKATAQVRLSIEGAEPTVVPIPLEQRDDGTWCVP